MTPKKRAAQVVKQYGYPELAKLRAMIEQAIIATIKEAEEGFAKERDTLNAEIVRLRREKREIEDRIANALL